MCRHPEEDDRLDVVDGSTKRLPIQPLADVSDGVAVVFGNRAGVLVDAVPVAEPDQSVLAELDPEQVAVDQLREPQMTRLEESVGRVLELGDLGVALHQRSRRIPRPLRSGRKPTLGDTTTFHSTANSPSSLPNTNY